RRVPQLLGPVRRAPAGRAAAARRRRAGRTPGRGGRGTAGPARRAFPEHIMSTGRDKRKRAIDWAAVRRRLARAAEASAGNVRLSPERARAIMEERARALARAPAEPAAAARVLEVLVFDIAGECYPIETAHVREV